jgi:hypothetical protein
MVFVFFSESQFASYRMLGAHTMEKLCTDRGGDFRCFIRDILKRQPENGTSGLADEIYSDSARRKQYWNRGAGACLKCLEFSCYEGYDRDNNNNNSMKVSTARFICRLLCQSASNHY